MQNHLSTRVVTVALLGVMTIPVAAQRLTGQVVVDDTRYAIFRSQDDEGLHPNGEDIRQDVLSYRSTLRAQRRAYSRAIDRCRDRLRDGEDIVCPDFNDPDSYGVDQPVHAAAPEEKVEVRRAPSSSSNNRAVVRKLSTEDRELLRTYTRAGYCSTVIGEYLYNLCRSIVGENDASTPRGFINDNVYLHGLNRAPRPTLKLRLQMMDEAISGIRGRRTGVPVPMRYRGGLNQ